MRSLIDITDFSIEELYQLMADAADIAEHPEVYSTACQGKTLATLFFEPSTRTRLSFEAAMLELGGNVIGFSNAGSSSASKGESMADTARVISCYADIMAIRHPLEGAPYVAAENASVPVINAGDGGHCHPTQTLADLLTIYREIGRFHDLTIGCCGDLMHGRTVHSLISALTRYENVKIVLISPKELQLPGYMKKEVLDKNGMIYEETESLEDVIGQLDVLYMTRIQQERFDRNEDYERLKDSYVLTPEKMQLAKDTMRVLHPLPRVNEISVKVDSDPRAAYFRQVLNGKFMRKALILKLLQEKNEEQMQGHDPYVIVGNLRCTNPRCITSTEQELSHKFKLVNPVTKECRCLYCEAKKYL